MTPLLFVSGEYPPDLGGVGDYTERLRSALSMRQWPSQVLSRRVVRRWDARSLAWLLRAAPAAGVVHIQFQAAAFELLGDVCLMPNLLRRVRPRVRAVTTFHDTRVPYLFPRAGGLRAAAVRLLARTSHVVIAADERDLDELGGPSGRHHLVPIGSNVTCSPPADFDRRAFRAQLGLEPNALLVAYFGLLNASKGLELLADAFSHVARLQPNARLVLLGGGVGASDPTDRATAAHVRDRLASLGQHALQTGWLAETHLSAYLLAADVALLPYRDGASPRRGSLLACAEHGLPIVSTLPATGIVANATHAVEPDAHSLASAVVEVANNPSLSARLRQASRCLAERVSWPTIADEHIAIYSDLHSGRTYTPGPW